MIRTVYHDFPLSEAAACLCERGNLKSLEGYFAEAIARSDLSVKSAEAAAVVSLAKDKWLQCPAMGLDASSAPLPARVHLLLHKFGTAVLDCKGEVPRVKFDQLLRWRQTSYAIGEDVLVTAAVAVTDVSRGARSKLAWPDVLDTDNVLLNSVLEGGITDIHTHLGASTDVAALNWIALMNHPMRVLGRKSPHRHKFYEGPGLGDDAFRRTSRYERILMDWGVIAARLRTVLSSFANGASGTAISESLLPISDALTGRINPVEFLNETRTAVSVARRRAAIATNGYRLDYAITPMTLQCADTASPYAVHVGERHLLYCFFVKYFSGNRDAIRLAPWMWLYVMIRVKMRRELVQTNALSGFDNFECYQDSKKQFYPDTRIESRKFSEIAFQYAVQSSVSPTQKMEARVTAGALTGLRGLRWQRPIFGKKPLHCASRNKLTFVTHFIKQRDNESSRMAEGALSFLPIRKRLKRELKYVIAQKSSYPVPVTGIDAAGSELRCSLEVFGPVFRQARADGITHVTYHAGEDFYDVLSGMQAVDEAVQFLELGSGDRIGHGLALGVDVAKYYAAKHDTLIMPSQKMLDALVWFRYRCADYGVALSSATANLTGHWFRTLIASIGYDTADMWIYRQSMLLRGDDPISEAHQADRVTHSRVSPAQRLGGEALKAAQKLLMAYLRSTCIKRNGAIPAEVKISDTQIAEISMLQDKMLDDLERKGIMIECNPTSNLKIGPFDRYDQLPIFRFNEVNADSARHMVPVSINTDDRGIFATSLRNEYALAAIALKKMKKPDGSPRYNDYQINNYLERVAKYGEAYRFQAGGTTI